MKALIISENDFEDSELMVPMYRLKEAHVDVDIAALHKGVIRGKRGIEVEANMSVDDVQPDQYDLLFLPGGKAPATLRKTQKVLDVTEHFMNAKKPVFAICHGPLILAAAGVIKNRNLTGYPAVRAAVEEAGATYHDQEVVIDDNLVTSRRPDDLPAFLRELGKVVS